MSNILLAGKQRTENPREIGTMNCWRARIVLLLTASGLFLYALPSPSLTYGAIVLLHVALGALLSFFSCLCWQASSVRRGWARGTPGRCWRVERFSASR